MKIAPILFAIFVVFTHPDGTPVAINPEAVASVHPTTKDLGYHAGTMIDSTGAGSEVVRESFEEVIERLDKKDCKWNLTRADLSHG